MSPQVAQWVMNHAPSSGGLDLEFVDLADWPLPDNEPSIPARGVYIHDQTRAWSRKIGEASAFVFVTPQYNWGYPAALKNALDHLYAEWADKPAVIVSYGFHGGGKAAAQLRQVLDGLHMRVAPTAPALTLPEEMKAEGASFDLALAAFAAEAPTVRQAFTELAELLHRRAEGHGEPEL